MRSWLSLLCLAACNDGVEVECLPTHAIVTDIDETLTTSDLEWVSQVSKGGDYDPAERPDASVLMNGYADLGYAIIYITARGQRVTLGDGRSATQATEDWLLAHGFPYQDDRLILAPGMSTAGEPARIYKAGALQELQTSGLQVAWAYGNATSDIDAFKDVGVPNDRIFLVGKLAGELDVVGIDDASAYAAHRGPQLADVPAQTGCR